MKTFLIAACIAITCLSCSKLEIAEDPILGIWKHQLQNTIKAEGVEIDAQEWIFNDLYKGRFHGYMDGKIVYDMDYQWSVDNGNYLLIYNGGDLPEINFTRADNQLINKNGKLVASRANQ